MVNLNDLAEFIAAAEGGKVQVNIAQIKEVLRRFGDWLRDEHSDSAFAVVARLLARKK